MRIDMHIHSRYSSDGKEQIEDIIKRAKSTGLGGVAITDHNSVKGWGEAVEPGKKYGMVVIRGEEVSSLEGHILAYGIEHKIEKGLSAEETVKRIKEAGGIAVAAHPYRVSNGLGEKVVKRVEFDAIEGINARSPSFINRKGMKLAEEMKRPVTGGSDAHTLDEIGKAYTVLPDGVKSERDVIEAIKSGNVSAGGSSQSSTVLIKQGFRKTTAWLKRGFRRI